MPRLFVIRLTALIAVCVCAGCAPHSPTEPAEMISGPRMTGVGFGSGNHHDPDTTTYTAQSTTAADSGSTAGLSGVGFGSGN